MNEKREVTKQVGDEASHLQRRSTTLLFMARLNCNATHHL